MKKTISLLLVLGVIFSLGACKDSTGSSETTQNTRVITITPSETSPTQETIVDEPTEPVTNPTEKPEDPTEESAPTNPTEETEPLEDPAPPAEPEETTPTPTEPEEDSSDEPAPSPPTPDNTTPTACQHSYALAQTKAASCTAAGSQTYTCKLCGDSYTQQIAATGHSYADAICVAPKTCSKCGSTTGSALGHSYAEGVCGRCGAADPDYIAVVTFTATVKSDKNVRLANITVTVYADGVLIGSAKTNSSGVATMEMMPASRYRVVLSDIPSGYTGKTEYEFTSARVNITLTTEAVIDPKDHSQAGYKVGSTMGDFTLTDTDGVTYTLSELLETRSAVILNFWYVSCEPCKAEFPYFQTAYERYGDKVQLLTLDPFDSASSIQALKDQMGITFPTMVDSIKLTQGFGISAFPTTVVIGKSGKILSIHTGSYPNESDVLNLFASYAG